MILYVNGDSHTAAAECVNNYAFAEDDPALYRMGRLPHPENLASSWGKLLSNRLSCGFKCEAESASSNDRIMRVTGEWISAHSEDLYRTLYVLQWSTWERKEWLINGVLYQINASGTDDVPESHQKKYKEFISNIDWKKETEDAHNKIWKFHLELEAVGAKHIFFNGNNDFSTIKAKKDWGNSYILPYDPKGTYDSVLSEKVYTVSPTSYHYGANGHRIWAQYMTKYIVDNQLV